MTMRTRKQDLAVLALGFAAGAVVFSEMLGPYLTWEGEPLSARILTIFLLPVTGSVIYRLIGSLRSPRAGTAPDATTDTAIDGIVLSVLVFLMSVHLLLLAALMRVQAVSPWAGQAVVVLVGLTLAAVGNLLPRTRPNAALGIRTARTLADRQLWMLMHRLGGYVAVAVGMVTVVSGLWFRGTQAAALPAFAFLAGAAVLVAGYWKYARVSSRARHA